MQMQLNSAISILACHPVQKTPLFLDKSAVLKKKNKGLFTSGNLLTTPRRNMGLFSGG